MFGKVLAVALVVGLLEVVTVKGWVRGDVVGEG